MEKGLNEIIKKEFGLKDTDPLEYSSLALAYIGDGVYEIIIRSLIIGRNNTKASRLHQYTSHIVKAQSQAALIESIEEELSQEEEAVYKRGRNAKSQTSAKNASIVDYRKATGFEALIGYLYLKDNTERILELVKLGLKRTGLEDKL